MVLALATQRHVTPYAVDGHCQQLRIKFAELLQQLVIERQLVTTHRTPVGRIKNQNHVAAAKCSQRNRLIRRRKQGERWGSGSGSQSGHIPSNYDFATARI